MLNDLSAAGIPVWLDGGWCVEALVGRQLRDHQDLDIAVPRSAESKLRAWLAARDYTEIETADAAAWNFAVQDPVGLKLDVHVFEHDERGEVSYGVAYPLASLDGRASLGGTGVKCITPEWMFQFKTAYTPREKDLIDIRALAGKYGFDIPTTHRGT